MPGARQRGRHPPPRADADWAGRRARINRRAQGAPVPRSKKLEEFSWAAHISPPLLTGARYSSRQRSGRVPLVFPRRLAENRFVLGPTNGVFLHSFSVYKDDTAGGIPSFLTCPLGTRYKLRPNCDAHSSSVVSRSRMSVERVHQPIGGAPSCIGHSRSL